MRPTHRRYCTADGRRSIHCSGYGLGAGRRDTEGLAQELLTKRHQLVQPATARRRSVGYVARFHGNRCTSDGNIAAVGAEILPKNHLGNGQWMPGHVGDTVQQRGRRALSTPMPHSSLVSQFASVEDDHSTILLMRRVLVERWRNRAGSGLSCGR
jgi:hypothetical protein